MSGATVLIRKRKKKKKKERYHRRNTILIYIPVTKTPISLRMRVLFCFVFFSFFFVYQIPGKSHPLALANGRDEVGISSSFAFASPLSLQKRGIKFRPECPVPAVSPRSSCLSNICTCTSQYLAPPSLGRWNWLLACGAIKFHRV